MLTNLESRFNLFRQLAQVWLFTFYYKKHKNVTILIIVFIAQPSRCLCESFNPCYNGGACFCANDLVMCKCKIHYYGNLCEVFGRYFYEL